MATGKKDYFRHSVKSRNDDFMLGLIKELGKDGYFMWFAMTEMVAELVLDGHEQPVTFHQSRLYKELRCSHRTLETFLTYCQDGFKAYLTQVQPMSNLGSTHVQPKSKVCWTYMEPMFNIEIYNLSKYVGLYSKKDSKERKEKKSKEKESKGNESPSHSLPFKVDDLVQLFNDTLARKAGRIEFCSGLTSGQVEQLEIAAGFPELRTLEAWKVLFEKIKLSKFYTGMEPGKDFVVTLNWLVNPEKARGLMGLSSTPSTSGKSGQAPTPGKWKTELEKRQKKAV